MDERVHICFSLVETSVGYRPNCSNAMIHHSSGEHLGKSGFLEVGRSNTLRANCLFHELVDCTLRFIAFRTEICFGSLHILSDVMSIYVILGIFSIQYFSSHPFSSFGSYTFLPFLQSLQIYILWSKWRKSPSCFCTFVICLAGGTLHHCHRMDS